MDQKQADSKSKVDEWPANNNNGDDDNDGSDDVTLITGLESQIDRSDTTCEQEIPVMDVPKNGIQPKPVSPDDTKRPPWKDYRTTETWKRDLNVQADYLFLLKRVNLGTQPISECTQRAIVSALEANHTRGEIILDQPDMIAMSKFFKKSGLKKLPIAALMRDDSVRYDKLDKGTQTDATSTNNVDEDIVEEGIDIDIGIDKNPVEEDIVHKTLVPNNTVEGLELPMACESDDSRSLFSDYQPQTLPIKKRKVPEYLYDSDHLSVDESSQSSGDLFVPNEIEQYSCGEERLVPAARKTNFKNYRTPTTKPRPVSPSQMKQIKICIPRDSRTEKLAAILKLKNAPKSTSEATKPKTSAAPQPKPKPKKKPRRARRGRKRKAPKPKKLKQKQPNIIHPVKPPTVVPDVDMEQVPDNGEDNNNENNTQQGQQDHPSQYFSDVDMDVFTASSSSDEDDDKVEDNKNDTQQPAPSSQSPVLSDMDILTASSSSDDDGDKDEDNKYPQRCNSSQSHVSSISSCCFISESSSEEED